MKILKKIFIISTVLLLVVLVFFGIYTIAFKKTDVREVKKDEDSGFELTDLVAEKMTNITSDPIIAATIGPDGNTVRYYDALDGRVWTMTLRGTNKEVLVHETMGVPQNVKWSADGDAAILTYKDSGIYVHNHATNTKNKLRDGMDNVEWAGASGKILYKYYDDALKERSLNIANSDGSGWKKIADLPYRFSSFAQIPSSIFAVFWPKASINTASELFGVNTISVSEPKKIHQGPNGSDYLFSPNGERVLVSAPVSGGKSMMLGVMDADGQNYNDLVIPTIVSKAVWSSDGLSVYYALPNDVPSNSVWPDDYDQRKFITQDTFFKLDIETGKKTRIIELEEIKEKIDAKNLFLSPSEDHLFFTDRRSGLLYRLDL